MTIATDAEAPIRVAPASIIALAASPSRTPPEALTPSTGPTALRMRATSSTDAPPLLKPVEVFTKCAPGLAAQPGGAHDLVLREQAGLEDDLQPRAEPAVQVAATAAMSLRTKVLHPRLQGTDVEDHVDLAGAVLDGPPCLVALHLGRQAPRKPTTVQTSTPEPPRISAQRRTQPLFTQTDAKPCSKASAHSLVDVLHRRVGLEQGVVDVARHVPDTGGSDQPPGERMLRCGWTPASTTARAAVPRSTSTLTAAGVQGHARRPAAWRRSR